MRSFEKLACILLAAVIVSGLAFAFDRERLRNPAHLAAIYADENRQRFNGRLPAAQIRVANLSEDNAAGMTAYDGKSFTIFFDSKSNQTEIAVRETLQHEMCHIATWQAEPDSHGPLFQNCLARK
jgi:hypothetical protein